MCGTRRLPLKLVVATIRLYVDAAKDAFRGFFRSALAFVVLLVAFPILIVAGMLCAPLGMMGGMLVNLLMDALAGTYLACLRDALSVRKGVSLAMVRGNFGANTWDIVGIQFPIWVVSFLLEQVGLSTVGLAFTVAVFLACNPVPEMVGRSRLGGVDLLQDAGRFMLSNGPEWFAGQVPFLVGLLFLGGAGVATGFGPGFGFVMVGGQAAGHVALGPLGYGLGLGVVAVTHLIMLFRGALYERLSSGGRRARAWQENFR